METAKKTIARFSKNLEFGNRTITFGVRHNFSANMFRHNSAAKWAREPFQPFKDAESLVVPIIKKLGSFRFDN